MTPISTGFTTGPDAHQHSGYAAWALDDGTITRMWSPSNEDRMTGQVVAACECGWAGTTRYPIRQVFDPDAAGLALAEWETAHAVPTLIEERERKVQLVTDLAEEAAHRCYMLLCSDDPAERAEHLSHVKGMLAEAAQAAADLDHQPEEPPNEK